MRWGNLGPLKVIMVVLTRAINTDRTYEVRRRKQTVLIVVQSKKRLKSQQIWRSVLATFSACPRLSIQCLSSFDSKDECCLIYINKLSDFSWEKCEIISDMRIGFLVLVLDRLKSFLNLIVRLAGLCLKLGKQDFEQKKDAYFFFFESQDGAMQSLVSYFFRPWIV